MPRLSQLEKGESIVQLVYGAAGVGKTHYAGTAGSRTVIFNTGVGISTLQSPGFQKRYPGTDPIIETVYEGILPDKASGHDELCDKLDFYLNPNNPEFNEYDTIVVDDATSLKRMAMSKGLEINHDFGKSKSLEASRKHGSLTVAVQDYGEEMAIVDQFITDYIMLCKKHNKHFILLAHERVEYGKAPGIGQPPPVIKVRPGFTGRTFPDSVTGHFDHVWYFETQGGGDRIFYSARTAGDSALVAKTRWDGVFPVMLKNPNFLDVVKTIRG